MANASRLLGDRRLLRYHDVEEFVPPSGWTEDSNGHYLLIQLPGFKKEQLRIEVASTGNIILSGERMVNESKAVYVEQLYKLPEDSDDEKITAKYDGELFYIIVPRLASKEEKEIKREHVENVSSITPGNAQEPPENSENPGRRDDGGHPYSQLNNNEKKVVDQCQKPGRVASFPKEFLMQLEAGPMERAMKSLKKNRGIVLALAVAFCLGVLVSQSQRFESAEQ